MGQNGTASNQTLCRSARPRDLGPGGLPAVRAALLRRYQELGTTLGLRTVRVRTGQQIPSAIGREEYVRVRLEEPADGGLPLALPVYGKSGLLGPLIRAHGLLRVDRDSEGLDQGIEATVLLFP